MDPALLVIIYIVFGVPILPAAIGLAAMTQIALKRAGEGRALQTVAITGAASLIVWGPLLGGAGWVAVERLGGMIGKDGIGPAPLVNGVFAAVACIAGLLLALHLGACTRSWRVLLSIAGASLLFGALVWTLGWLLGFVLGGAFWFAAAVYTLHLWSAKVASGIGRTCVRCGYSLAGLPRHAMACPECGARVSVAEPARPALPSSGG